MRKILLFLLITIVLSLSSSILYANAMPREQVDSSVIASIGYDKEKEILEIEFNNGKIYQYFHVPKKVYNELMDAPSHGKYFNAYIKSNYNYERIE